MAASFLQPCRVQAVRRSRMLGQKQRIQRRKTPLRPKQQPTSPIPWFPLRMKMHSSLWASIWFCRPRQKIPPFFILNGEVAEIQFTADGVSYSFRASNTAEDFAGIFERFTDHVLETSYESGDMSAAAKIRTTESGGRLASWNWDETNYTLYTAAQISDEAITAFVQELLELTCSQ